MLVWAAEACLEDPTHTNLSTKHMRVKLDSEIDPNDIPAVNLSLQHAAKKSVAEGYDPRNPVEYTLIKISNNLFETYLDSIRSEIIDIVERNQ